MKKLRRLISGGRSCNSAEPAQSQAERVERFWEKRIGRSYTQNRNTSDQFVFIKNSQPILPSSAAVSKSPTESRPDLILYQTQICAICWRKCFSTKEYRDFCQEMGIGGEVKYEVHLSDVAESVESGCSWCVGLLTGIESARPLNRNYLSLNSRQTVNVRMAPELRRRNGVISLEVFSEDRPQFRVRGSLIAQNNRQDRKAPSLPSGLTRTNFREDYFFDAIREWLDECTQTHTECRSKPCGRVPSRLIDLSDQARPRLVITDVNEQYTYATLSYCWGLEQKGTLSTTNLIERLQHLNLLEVSQAVRDAVLVVSRIGLRYLWIDAMCIVQDDDSDKENEIAAMCDIYRNAYLTVSATNSPSAAETFLEIKSLETRRSRLFDNEIDFKDISIPYWMPDESLGICSIQSIQQCNPKMEPANLRAWTLQEKVLSSREISYTSFSVELLCSSATICLNEGVYDTCLYNTHKSPLVIPQPTNASDLAPLASLVFSWTVLCNDYSTRAIGLESERLTALAGLAEHFSKDLKTPYLAGVWGGSLLMSSLLWRRKPFQRRRPLGKSPELFPSWSWLAVGGPVEWMYVDFLDDLMQNRCLVTVVSSSTTLHNPRLPFGPVTGGYIVLLGAMKTLIYCRGRFHKIEDDRLHRIDRIHGRIDEANDQDTPEAVPVQLLAVFEYAGGLPSRFTKGLILAACPSAGNPHVYRRIGMFEQAKPSYFAMSDVQTITLV